MAFWLLVGAVGRSTRAKPATRPEKSRSFTTLARSRSICGSILWMKVRFSGENSMPTSWVAAQTHTRRSWKVAGRRQIHRWCRMAKVLFCFWKTKPAGPRGRRAGRADFRRGGKAESLQTHAQTAAPFPGRRACGDDRGGQRLEAGLVARPLRGPRGGVLAFCPARTWPIPAGRSPWTGPDAPVRLWFGTTPSPTRGSGCGRGRPPHRTCQATWGRGAALLRCLLRARVWRRRLRGRSSK